jgi:hypothetical protein
MPPPSQLVKRWQRRRAKLLVCSVASPLAPQLEASRCVLYLYIVVLHEMEPCAEHPSVRFKQRAVIAFLAAERVFQSKFTYVCNLFTVMTVLTRAMCVVVGPTDVKMTRCVV